MSDLWTDVGDRRMTNDCEREIAARISMLSTAIQPHEIIWLVIALRISPLTIQLWAMSHGSDAFLRKTTA
jgi:hypothetical protein